MSWKVVEGNCLDLLGAIPEGSAQTCVTSPPYWGLRDYGEGEQLGLEATPEEYIANIVEVFRGVWRVLRDDGTLWLNLGDSYAGGGGGNYGSGLSVAAHKTHPRSGDKKPKTPNGLKPKDLVGIPWRVALALQADGWYLRSDIIWHKPNPMPESVTDRPTKAHEYIFLLTKQPRYYYDADAIREGHQTADRKGDRRSYKPGSASSMNNGSHEEMKGAFAGLPLNPAGRNRRSVWTVTTKPFSGAHFAVFPPDLIEPCVLAGTSEGGGCSECGTPYERIVEKGEPILEQQRASGGDANGEYHGAATKDFESARAQDASATKARILAGMVERKTTGWQPTCECGGESEPQTVIDPFSGAGTTGLVALRHNRSYVGLELNPDYAELSRNRIREDAPLLNTTLEAVE